MDEEMYIYIWHSVFIQYNQYALQFAVRRPDASGVGNVGFAKSAILAHLLAAEWTLAAAMLMYQQTDSGGSFRGLYLAVSLYAAEHMRQQ